MTAPRRPVLRWHGGKWRLASWIIGHFPAHRVYVEPYGGAASVLLRKPRSYAEVYNDLDGEAVNLFRVLRHKARADQLLKLLALTPFAREEFADAMRDKPSDDVERARQLIVLSFQGFGSNAHARRSTGFRSATTRSGTTPAFDWAGYPHALAEVIDRLRGVVIESRPAMQVMAKHDGPETLHYVDPPYIWATRSDAKGHHPKWQGYNHELTDADHRELLTFLRGLRGHVVLSGYRHPIYDEALSDWRVSTKESLADGARPRTEVLWLNPAAAAALNGASQRSLEAVA